MNDYKIFDEVRLTKEIQLTQLVFEAINIKLFFKVSGKTENLKSV